MFKKTCKITGSVEYLSEVLRWCCKQWPRSNNDWDVVYESINWQTGDYTVKYKFKDQDKAVLFLLKWKNS